MRPLLQPFLFLLSDFLIVITLSPALGHRICHDDQSSALLQLKQSFSLVEFASSSCLKLASWKAHIDCCYWDAVTCDMDTGNVIGLDLSNSCLSGPLHSNSTLFHLAMLQRLNLAYNHFNSSPIPSGLGLLKRLTHLNLSYSSFSGQIPFEILQLTGLVSLDLSSFYDSQLKLEKFSLRTLVQDLSGLRELHLDQVNISSSVVRDVLGNLSSLKSLSLKSCGLYGQFPRSNRWFTNIKKLALGGNPGLSGYFPEIHSGNNSLRFLDLSETSFSGELPNSIGNLKYLNHLNLSGCQFSGLIPPSLTNLSQLVHLDLSSNQLTGPILSLFALPLCEILDLSRNRLTGYLNESNLTLSSLKQVDLSDNEFDGPIPRSISKLRNLTVLDLSLNHFSGTVELDMFQNLENLFVLDLSNNNLSLITNASFNSVSPQFEELRLSSCNISEFPDFLRNQEMLWELDLSNNKIRGQIPKWLWNIGKFLQHLDLSRNMLNGWEQPPAILPWSNLLSLNLSFNMLEGSLPIPPRSTIFFSASNNKIEGEIPSLICTAISLQFLDLSKNQLSGIIPHCLGNFSNFLSVLKLRGNNFHGTIPQTFAGGSVLRMLDLNANELEGKLPRSLANCKNLEVLELGNNQINDTFPFWLDTLPNLRVLVLRTNNFHGPIGHPRTNFSFSMLRILDLTHNNFTSHLPTEYFCNWKAMMMIDEDKSQLEYMGNSYYHDSVTIMKQGQEMVLVNIITIFKVVDLSDNRFQGEIPECIGNLKALTVLDLSHNSLTGLIPSSLRNLTKLESLDLSENRLQGSLPILPPNTKFFSISNNALTGEIPSLICRLSLLQLLDLSYNQISGLLLQCLGNFSTFLSVLKLRGNNLHGSIPQTFTNGTSLRTLDLNTNQFGGPLPRSLSNCRMLEVLDLGNNQINDVFPFWLESLPELLVLVLRSNRFHGPIESSLTDSSFSKLSIIDISYNKFTSNLPSKYFWSWKAMMMVEENESQSKYIGNSYYRDSVTVTNKGQEMELVKIITIFRAVDLSNNKFQGEIPESIGNLRSLIVLNLSSNSLTGVIPSSFGNLIKLGSLDLSMNRLSGEIPWQLTSLTFLAVLDLSQNLLVGPIPRGRQFETFENTSFEGNSGLCGFPLSKECGYAEEPDSPPETESTSEFDWEFMLMGYGCGVIIGIVVGHMICKRKHEWFVRTIGVRYLNLGRGKGGRRVGTEHQQRRSR